MSARCGGRSVLTSSSEFYGARCYGCPDCSDWTPITELTINDLRRIIREEIGRASKEGKES